MPDHPAAGSSIELHGIGKRYGISRTQLVSAAD